MRRWLLALLLAAGPARADEPTPEAPPLPHVVGGRIDGTVVRLVARFAVHGEAPGIWSPTSLPIPDPSIITGATAIVAGVSHRLLLVGPAEADDRFQAIGDGEPAANRQWAVKISSEAGVREASVEIAAPKAARIEVELELELPTCFYRDVRYAAIPPDWKTVLDAELASHVRARVPGIAEACSGQDDSPWLGFATHEIANEGDVHAGVRAGRLDVGATHFARVELDLARELGDVPADLHTAIVIDASRSVTEGEAAEQRAIVAAYLRAAPHSSVQVIAYARDAHALLPAWTDAGTAAPQLAAALQALVARNGSNVDRGLQEAGAWLARTAGTNRIILFSDQRVAHRLEHAAPAELLALIPAGTLVHVVGLSGATGALERADDVMFESLADATQGIGVASGSSEQAKVDATILAHPISLDHIELAAPGWTRLDNVGSCTEDSLAQGRACTWWGRGGVASGPVMIRGLAWNKPFARMVRPDPMYARQLARELTMSSALDGDPVREAIEHAAFAVDGEWSMLGTWGGSGGYSDLGSIGSIGGSMSGDCCGDVGTSSSDRGVTMVTRPPALDLRAQFADAVARCKPEGARVAIEIETTQQEIVDVAVAVTGAGAREAAIRGCITEGVWDTAVSIKDAPEHATTRFSF